MAGPLRCYNQVPMDSGISPDTYQFLQYLLVTVNALQPSLFQPNAPLVTTISQPGGVQIVWNEVQNAVAYALYETSTASSPPGVPISTVPANTQAASNSYLRSGINDTVTRFYSVVAIGNTNRSMPSTPVAGKALSTAATIVPISENPVNQEGVGGDVGGGGGIPGKTSNTNTTF